MYSSHFWLHVYSIAQYSKCPDSLDPSDPNNPNNPKLTLNHPKNPHKLVSLINLHFSTLVTMFVAVGSSKN